MADEKKRKRKIELLHIDLRQAKELYDLGQISDAYNSAEYIYQESQLLKDNILMFDALMIMTEISIMLGNLKTTSDLISKGEVLFQTFSDDSLKEIDEKKAELFKLKGNYFFFQGELDGAKKFYTQVLGIEERLGNKKNIAIALGLLGDCLALRGEVDEGLKYIKQSQIICEELDLKARKAQNLVCLSAICYTYGNLVKSLDFLNKSIIITKEINHKPLIAVALNNLGAIYQIMGDLNSAMNAWERCLEITEEIGFKFMKVAVLDFLIKGAIEKGDHLQAERYLQIVKEINEKEKTKHTNTIYLFNKALILKMSLRARDRADAEDLFKELISKEPIISETKILALINLCDLLLKELQITGYMEILDELQSFISQLLEISEHMHSYLFMAEAYLLQARLSLLTLNLKESKRFFTQAQQIAEKWGFSQLSTKIATEKEDFLKQMNKWEKFKETNAPLNDRLELVRFDEQIERMLQNRSQLTGQVIEEKVDIHKEKKICMICKGDVAGYIYVCECDAIYCENCVKALIDLENACWVCETPIDQSKPIKHFKKKEVEIKNKNILEEGKESPKK